MRCLMVLLVMVASGVSAAAMDCEPGAVVRCFCPASMSINCGDNYRGWVKDEEKPTAITFKILDSSTGRERTIVLNNPPGGIRDYYGGLDTNRWLRSQVEGKGLTWPGAGNVSMIGAKMPDSTTLYHDPDMREAVAHGTVAEPTKNSDDVKLSCDYIETPTIVSDGSCGKKICASHVDCNRGKQHLGKATVGCKAIGGQCPDATTCANDQDILTESSTQMSAKPTLSSEKLSTPNGAER